MFRKIPFKILSLILLAGIMVAILLVFQILSQNINKDADRLKKMQIQISIKESVYTFIYGLQNERGKSFTYLAADDRSLRDDMAAYRSETDVVIRDMESQLTDLELMNRQDEKLAGLIEQIFQIREKVDERTIDAESTFDLYSGIILNLLDETLRGTQTEFANIMIEVVSQYHLMKAAEQAAKIRGVVYNHLYSENGFEEETDITDLKQKYNDYQQSLKDFTLFCSGNLKNTFDKEMDIPDVLWFEQTLERIINRDMIPTSDPENWWLKSTRAINAINRIVSVSEAAVGSYIFESEKNITRQKRRTLIVFVFLASVIFLGYLIFLQAINRVLLRLNYAARQLSLGSSNFELPVHSRDMIGRLSESLNKVAATSHSFSQAAKNIGEGNYDQQIETRGDEDILGISLEKMRINLLKYSMIQKDQEWFSEGKLMINELLLNVPDINKLPEIVLNYLVPFLKSQVGAVYLVRNKELILSASYALDQRKLKKKIPLGDGLAGQAAKEGKTILFQGVPPEYLKIHSAVGNVPPVNIIVMPLLNEGELLGIIEIGSSFEYTTRQVEFLENIAWDIVIVLSRTLARKKMDQIQNELNQQITTMNASALVSMTDVKGNITYANDTFCKISKYSREELIGKNHRIIKSGKQPDGLFVGMWKAISNGRVWKGEICNKAKDGSYYWVDVTIAPFKGVDGKIEKYVAIRWDITEQKKQQQELKEYAEELKAQTDILKSQQDELQAQQEELVSQNEDLVTNTTLLEQKTRSIELQNRQLEETRKDLEIKAQELAIASQFKSEFLANMSHELRTPLNSILLLSRLLTENTDKNLTDDQIEFARVINTSGESLLEMINSVLDLSKVESGKMVFEIMEVEVGQIGQTLKDTFTLLAQKKNIEFEIETDSKVPETMTTDRSRLEQVLKNLLNNALKFTEEGEVKLKIFKPDEKLKGLNEGLDGKELIAFAVSDTGIGIPNDKQNLIFEAFQQAERSTQRQYGGTGLGLSISKEIVTLLGGELTLESKEGEGSTFTVYLPVKHEASAVPKKEKTNGSRPAASDLPIPEEIPDDRDLLKRGDKSFLIIEDDTAFAKSLLKFARDRGYKGIVAARGDKGLEYARKYKPLGILLDTNLPVMNGWEVIKELKEDPETRPIPVCIMSSLDIREKGIHAGAVNFVNKAEAADKPDQVFSSIEQVIERKGILILIIEDDDIHRKALEDYLNMISEQWTIRTAKNAGEGWRIFNKEHIDCLILDMGLPGETGYQVLEKLRDNKRFETLPVIIYTGASFSAEEETKIKKLANTIVIKTAKSYERLVDELKLYLHISGPKIKKTKSPKPAKYKSLFKNKNVLLVDDDIRNIFSLTAILENQGMNIFTANNGKEALEALEKDPGIDIVLMDIMMPVMDGYKAMTKIREQKKFKDLPVIAVTVKSMSKEREECTKAGASDYVSKPVDLDQLISLMKIWLSN